MSVHYAYHWVTSLWYAIQHRTGLIIFPLILQTITIGQIIVYLNKAMYKAECSAAVNIPQVWTEVDYRPAAG